MKLSRDQFERIAMLVLEDAAFLRAAPRGTLAAMDEPAIGVRLTFAGPRCGYLEVWAPPALTQLLAIHMLGVADDCEAVDEMGTEALKETLNILCGNLLAELAGPDPVFELGLPVLLTEGIEGPLDGCVTIDSVFDVEGHPVRLRAGLLHEDAAAA